MPFLILNLRARVLSILFGLVWLIPTSGLGEELPALKEIWVSSTADGSRQPALIWEPETARTKPTPLLVYLHSWSGDYRQKNTAWQREAVERGWIYLHPDFRGPNNRPEACGSKLARQDILDAMEYVAQHAQVDASRIYLAGTSGGGHMAMLMAGYFPERFSAVSSWVGISDLADWYRFHTEDGEPQRYARMILTALGGAPGTSPEIAARYRARSPIFHLQRVGKLPLDLNAGVRDGHDGSVPIFHTLRAYNVVAEAHGDSPISESSMKQLWEQGRLTPSQFSGRKIDPSYGRAILLRQSSGATRVTIFDGGHEGIARAACAWLAKQTRATCDPDAEMQIR